jgi:mxaK protein
MRRDRAFVFTLAALLAVTLAAAGTFATRLWLDHRANTDIAALAGGRDVPVAADARPELLFARLAFLTARDRFDEAQPLMNRIAAAGERAIASAAYYDLSNARLRAALSHLEINEIDPAVPLVRLAKEGYRRALVLDPGFWDAKYNLDIAMRLVRDFPQIETSGEELPPEAAKRLWTDLPGLPRGLP